MTRYRQATAHAWKAEGYNGTACFLFLTIAEVRQLLEGTVMPSVRVRLEALLKDESLLQNAQEAREGSRKGA